MKIGLCGTVPQRAVMLADVDQQTVTGLDRPRPTRLRRPALLAALIAFVLLGAATGFAAVRFVVSAIPTQATRPCEDAFADRLLNDPIFVLTVPGDRGKDLNGSITERPEEPLERGPAVDGGCTDSDDGGVSYAEVVRSTTLAPTALAKFFAWS